MEIVASTGLMWRPEWGCIGGKEGRGKERLRQRPAVSSTTPNSLPALWLEGNSLCKRWRETVRQFQSTSVGLSTYLAKEGV